MLNRTAVLVRPAAPYLSWAAAVQDSELPAEDLNEATVYLIPEVGNVEEAWEVLEECFATIFENELWLWTAEEERWPAERTFDTFREWFVLEFSGEIHDLCDYPIEDDDLDELDYEDEDHEH